VRLMPLRQFGEPLELAADQGFLLCARQKRVPARL
jgi:hypothetical protein